MLHTKPRTGVSEQMSLLVYELLDAHNDTSRLADDLELDGRWQVHLDYLRDLQRLGRETLATQDPQPDPSDDPRAVCASVLRRVARRCARNGAHEGRT